MKKEFIVFIEKMIDEVKSKNNKGIDKIDEIWDKNYDAIVDLVVEEMCVDKVACNEEQTHDIIADIRSLYYKEIENI